MQLVYFLFYCAVVHSVNVQYGFSKSDRHITYGSVRFSFLTPSVIRVEDGGVTEDRPSITFPTRYSQPIPNYQVLSSNPLVVKTDTLTLSFDPAGNGSLKCKFFNVSFVLPNGQTMNACLEDAKGRTPLDPQFPGILMDEWTDIIRGPPGNLNGSVDTTDCYIGSDGCYGALISRLQLGLVSREGWAVVDDSNTSLWDDDTTWKWRIPRNTSSSDLYIFAHGHDYKSALRDFTNLAGPIPLKPWRSYGVWTSREYPYTDVEMMELTETYEKYELPLNMIVLDYAWHYGPANSTPVEHCNQPLVAGGQCLTGYGGYVWNKDLFPNPKEFQEWAHSQNFELCLNIHDQCGIDSCQIHYAAAAKMNGIDPSTKNPVQCNLLEKSYANSQSTLMLENDENQNVDYWWNDYGVGGPNIGEYQCYCDPNDSRNSSFPNGPPSFGHCMHCYKDSIKEKPQLWNAYIRVSRKEIKDERGMVLGIYGGLGHHRYPAVGSGDTFENWNTIAFEVSLTISAANVGVEWNHDLGGFMPGPYSVNIPGGWLHNPEIYLRWIQFGVFQPIFRTHVSDGGDPSPWRYPNFEIIQQAFQLRNALFPYLYTASYRAYSSGVLPIHPLYYEFPENEESYTVSTLNGPNSTLQYMFGSDFVVAPITTFSDPATHQVSWPTWVPPGTWVDWWTGEVVTGPIWRKRNYQQSEIPLIVRQSSIIPMKTMSSRKSLIADPLVLMVIWGGNGIPSELYEDDGTSLQYQNGAYYILRAIFTLPSNNSGQLQVTPCFDGKGFSSAPDSRSYFIKFRNAPKTVNNVKCPLCPSSFTWFWENQNSVFVVSTDVMKYNTSFEITLEF